MSFSTDIAELVANQLSRFVTLNRHQLAGQAANLEFWVVQVRLALDTIDGYGAGSCGWKQPRRSTSTHTKRRSFL